MTLNGVMARTVPGRIFDKKTLGFGVYHTKLSPHCFRPNAAERHSTTQFDSLCQNMATFAGLAPNECIKEKHPRSESWDHPHSFDPPTLQPLPNCMIPTAATDIGRRVRTPLPLPSPPLIIGHDILHHMHSMLPKNYFRQRYLQQTCTTPKQL